MERRNFLKKGIGAGAATIIAQSAVAKEFETVEKPDLKGNINHSVCKWCYDSMSVEELAIASNAMGIKSMEIVYPDAFPILKKYNLSCAMTRSPQSINKGWNRLEHHDEFVPGFIEAIDQVSAAGFKNLIVFSGIRDGMDDEEGLENCVTGLKRIMSHAEAKNVDIVMELLNSKVDHKDYMCDFTPWGVKLVNAMGSDNFGLLYDIYHMQIMEGDVIRTIQDNHQYFKHYHTGGNPGRNEIDETQELNYPAIMRAILETGYTGFVGQEFIPTRPPLTSLGQAISLCDV